MFDAPVQRRAGPPRRRLTIAERFAEYHRANPHVYWLLLEIALDQFEERTRKGLSEHLSMKYIFEIARSDYRFKTTASAFKLDNNFTSHYARLLAENESKLRDAFEFRPQRS